MKRITRPTVEPDEDFAILIKTKKSLVARIDAEASRERRSRTQQVIRIFQERYGLVEQPEELRRISA